MHSSLRDSDCEEVIFSDFAGQTSTSVTVLIMSTHGPSRFPTEKYLPRGLYWTLDRCNCESHLSCAVSNGLQNAFDRFTKSYRNLCRRLECSKWAELRRGTSLKPECSEQDNGDQVREEYLWLGGMNSRQSQRRPPVTTREARTPLPPHPLAPRY
jgi:hypothetical protein